ncbi:AraC family transcriptional regulator with amidase-like domain [Hoeflea marina]|uniref:AraC family transcriptional regulator with amidase-like domain n=2 Tax=Hoeflea marina TaxID=274592 RepID=A0A317PRF1_9HYPH|nr:AraC family transcriptional regulator with amidase-like domain [Hoeflea marina]
MEDGSRPLSVDILVLSGSSLMTAACAGDPLRAANRVSGRKLFDWRYVSLDGRNPVTTAGGEWPVSGRFDPGLKRDVLAIVSGFHTAEMQDRRVISRIFQAAKNARSTIGVESGAWMMARAGLLDGRNATTHWEDFEEFAAAFPLVNLRPDRYVTDGRYVTTSGASPTFDMMIDLVRRHAGLSTALDVASVFVYEAARGASDVQSVISFGPGNSHDPRVVKAIRAMEMCIDAPVTIAAIAKRISLSVRGLEQLFTREVGSTPGAYFLVLRLNAARRLVLDTSLRMTDIALRTGFSSEAAFSRAFKREFGAAPAHYRAQPPNR